MSKQYQSDSHSLKRGWNRGCDKYSTKQFDLSPTKQISCVVKPINLDASVNGYVWILNMSEQFFYENSLNLFISNQYTENSLSFILRSNTTSFDTDNILKTWTTAISIGKGAFGAVYKVFDKILNDYVAVKHLTQLPANARRFDNTSKVLLYLKERYYLMQAYSSPFIIKFLHSFQLPKINGLFLVTDFCICDMNAMLTYLSKYSAVNVPGLLLGSDENPLDAYHEDISQLFRIDMQEIFVVYFFEFFCMLDFLAKCNIVHRDIKPDNIMLAANGHLKLGDFGLVNNTRFIHDETLMELIKPSDLEDEEDTSGTAAGTLTYLEMEAIFVRLVQNGLYDKLKKEPGFEPPQFRHSEFMMEFSSDLWSFGIVITELLFLGLTFTNTSQFYSEFKQTMGLEDKDLLYDLGKMLFTPENYQLYFIDGFKGIAEGYLKEIIELLPEIFIEKRLGRLKEFTKPVNFAVFNKKYPSYQIDMTKIETINVFKDRSLTTETVKFYDFPKRYLSMTKKLKNDLELDNEVTIEEWLTNLQSNVNDKKLFAFEPGCTLKYN